MSRRLRSVWGVGGAAVATAAVVSVGSASADQCANATFRTGASADLPDCRAYEQVSPQRKFGQGVRTQPATAGGFSSVARPGWSDAAGNRFLLYPGGGPGIADAIRGFSYPQTSVRAEAGGWTTRPAIDGPAPDSTLNSVLTPARMVIPSADRRQLLFRGFLRFSAEQPPSALDGAGAVHLAGPDGRVQWVSKPGWANANPAPGAPGLDGVKFVPVGGSDDLSTVYFMTRQVLTPEDAASGRTWDQGWALYKVKDGVLSNAGVLPPSPGHPEGQVDPSGSMSAGVDLSIANADTGINLSSTLGASHVVSRKGDRALFTGLGSRTVPGRTTQLYLHRDGTTSLLLSKPAAGSAPIAGSTGVVPLGTFETSGAFGAELSSGVGVTAMGNRDLDVVYFATRDALVSGAPSDGTRVNTYRLDVEDNDLQYLADLDRAASANEAGSPTRGLRGNVYRVSDDGSRVLFRTDAGQVKLWRDGLPTLTVATGIGLASTFSNGITGARFSADGRTVVFMSRDPNGGEPNHPAGNGPDQTQIYRFEEGVDSTARCVSCPPPSATVRGPAAFDLFTPYNNGFAGAIGTDNTAAQNRAISSDGSRVFFTTTSTLDPRDRNATADVYEWSADRGTPVLLSSGDPNSRGDDLMDIDATGDNVFFTSEMRLTASDTDELADLYVARVGGGLPDPPGFDREPQCDLTSCQGAGPAIGPLPGAGSDAVGAVTEGHKESAPAGQPSFAVRRSRASSAQATLGVATPGAGTIRVSGRGVRTTSRRVSRASTYTIHARLTAAAKRRAARSGRTTLALRVRFTPSSGKAQTKTVRVTVKRTRKSNRKAGR